MLESGFSVQQGATFSAEVDADLGAEFQDLDYMHARYYAPRLGRFLSVDPIGGELLRPQSWNRYVYARNNPLKWVDPTGETISLAGLTEDQREELKRRLEALTGNTYEINESLELVLGEVGAGSSETATTFLNEAISSADVFNVQATTGPNRGDPQTKEVSINFESFSDVKYGKVDPRTFNLGSTFLHELYHSVTGIEDYAGIVNLGDFSHTGPVVDFVNSVRAERGFPQRASYLTDLGIGKRSRFRFDHVNAKKPEKIYYVRRRPPAR